ncbi:MAG TPA: hypothetical protein VNE62_07050, partial [Actinomycetota bacterium]|nr:hypothetical protein [Actinomycetota bacterium]
MAAERGPEVSADEVRRAILSQMQLMLTHGGNAVEAATAVVLLAEAHAWLLAPAQPHGSQVTVAR